MISLNNKGQSLILFLLIIPLLLGIIALVVDVGNALSKKGETDNVIEFVLDYGLDKNEVFFENEDNEYYNEDLVNGLDDIKLLLSYNLSDNENEVIFEGDAIVISSKTYVEGIFSNILNIKGFKIESQYKGYMNDDKEVIEKIK